jgi:CheY-like chemotaxis protein
MPRSPVILLVDDEGPVRRIATIFLSRAGYVVLEAASPAEAEALFAQADAVDLLVTDIMMPGQRGPELYKRLAVQNPSLPVLFISGYAPDDSLGIGNLKASAFLQKPFASDLLIRTVDSLLNPGE